MLFLIEIILQRDFSRYVWLRSDKFFDHLEELFTVHLPSTAEWTQALEVIYHDFLLPKDPMLHANRLKPTDKQVYEKNYAVFE